MAKQLVPLADRVIVRRATADEVTAGGIIVPDSAKEKMQEGTIVAIGDECYDTDDTAGFTVGSSVLFGKYAGVEVEIEKESLLIMREEELIALIVETE